MAKKSSTKSNGEPNSKSETSDPLSSPAEVAATRVVPQRVPTDEELPQPVAEAAAEVAAEPDEVNEAWGEATPEQQKIAERITALKSNRRVVLAMSGGMDSTTLAFLAKRTSADVGLYAFAYGGKHNQYEHIARHLLQYALGEVLTLNLKDAFRFHQSHLMRSGGPIPEGHYEAESMKQTVVPARNLVFISLLAGIAESIGFDTVWLGVHAGDHAIYPDCREEFVKLADKVVQCQSEGRVKVEAPFIKDDKESILRLGTFMSVPYRKTRTCYKNQPQPCGKCGSCTERLEAFQRAGLTDPAMYET